MFCQRSCDDELCHIVLSIASSVHLLRHVAHMCRMQDQLGSIHNLSLLDYFCVT